MENRETDWSRDALERIVALLFALANLADLAAGAPFLRRRRVLGIVNRGEIEARGFVIGMVSGAQVSADALEPSGDAASLAVRLRALALVLCVLLARRGGLPGAAGSCTGRRSHRISGSLLGSASRPLAPDTS
jgi:hypothetical protein